MGAALNSAAATRAYVLCDRSTWPAFKNKKGLEGQQVFFPNGG